MTTARPDLWREVSAARLPRDGIAALGRVRNRPDVRVHITGAVAWVRWPAGRADVVRCLLPVPGVTFFTRRDGSWVPFGRLVPTGDAPPGGEGSSVAAVLAPGRFEPLAPEPPAWAPLVLTVARGGGPEPVTAAACAVGALEAWAATATTAELGAVRGARCGGRAVLLGAGLPALVGATRYWGGQLLVPVGLRPDPDLPEAVLREAAGATDGELLVLDESGAEVVPVAAFEPLTRAGVRLGARNA